MASTVGVFGTGFPALIEQVGVRRGPTVDELLAEGPFDPLHAALIARELAVTVAALHREGLCHGALDGSAVVVTSGARARLIDPKGLNGSGATASEGSVEGDLRALGVLLRTMLTGGIGTLDDLAGPGGLVRICKRAVRDDGRGYPSADALARALGFFLLRRRVHLA